MAAASVIVRREFRSGPFGQMHLRTARPTDGSGLRFPALVCLHPGPQSGSFFNELLPLIATDRIVYAPDYPGNGDSDPPPSPPRLEDYAETIATLIDELGPAPFDVLGHHAGSAVAVALTHLRAERVRRIVLIGLPVIEAADLKAMDRSASGESWPLAPKLDGSHVLDEWRRSVFWQGERVPLPIITRGFIDKVRIGQRVSWASSAALKYAFAEQLSVLPHPILGIGPKDDLWDISPRGERLIRNGSFERWPEFGWDIVAVGAERVSHAIRAHLDVTGA